MQAPYTPFTAEQKVNKLEGGLKEKKIISYLITTHSAWKILNYPGNIFEDYYNKLLEYLSRNLTLTNQPTCSSTSNTAEVNTRSQGICRGCREQGRG